ncbi:unnamed protein product [Owenia fusiformis]|uniref:Uncharacterized protein n=1 Tax=Owenia fusiformis TaxID=6347 RepID=A0A8J1UEL1_OWEFU|nr:unnamed protein product [Owenia fusiformis]
MPFKVQIDKCPVCDKAVYANEARLCASEKFHKYCFKCSMCAKMLDSTTVANHGVILYCKQCHGKKHGPKGYGFGGGAGALSMDQGERHGNVESEMGNKPTEVHVGAATACVKPEDGGCPRCGKRVYDAEKVIGAGWGWHKNCFRCKPCNKSLDSTTCTDKDGELYCKSCYAKQFGPHGKI